MVFERVNPSDAEALTALRLAYLAEDLGDLSEDMAASLRQALPDYFRRSLNRSMLGYVARHGQAVVACALLLLVEKPMSPAFPNGRTGTVFNVYTAPGNRRMGCARHLMEMLLEDARSRDLCVVELKATEAGLPLYRSIGFCEDIAEYRAMTWRPQ